MKDRFKFFLFCNITFLVFLTLSCNKTTTHESKEIYEADVIIYGGTSAAIIAAVEVIQSGKTAIVVSPDKHLGGMSSSGLGYTDSGKKDAIGGMAKNFYHRIWQHYTNDSAWVWEKKEEFGNKGQDTPAIDTENYTMWIFEPHVAESVFEDYVKEFNIPVMRDEWLDRTSGVEKKKGKIISVTTLSKKLFKGKMFIDATYEGDLMAAANVSYRVGRESNTEYNENWNGVQKGTIFHGHNFYILNRSIDPYIIPGEESSGLLPLISPKYPGNNGDGDEGVQAYCFRVCMSKNPQNRIPFPKPEKYDSLQYELLVRIFDTGWDEWFVKFDAVPNKKTDTNNHGPFSSDYIGMNFDYPDASYERRREIIEEHENYQKGLLWFVSNDKRVPEKIRIKMNEWGLPKDEFKDNENWPHQLYIREARRMVGSYVMSEKDILGKPTITNSIGLGSYTLDSHNVSRYVDSNGRVQNEGDVGLGPDEPYRISYSSVIPKKKECTNLLVPVCISATHIAYGSVRMEPVFMILAQSCATAAVIAIEKKLNVQDVPYDELSKLLIEKKQILTWNK